MPLLTKSRLITALDCTTKLYYQNHPETYANKAVEDQFLQALADGGFQVGELAKKYYPATNEITETNPEKAIQQTANFLKSDAVLHEACFGFDQKFFIKADIVIKTDNQIHLYEVKAKSINSSNPNEIIGKKGTILSKWKKYIYDLTFQFWVIKKAFPQYEIIPYLLLADKDKTATVDGLNQHFRIKRENGNARPIIMSTEKPKSELGEEILSPINLREVVQMVLKEPDFEKTGRTFEEHIYYLADICMNDQLVYDNIGKKCKDCEFNYTDGNLKNGLDECWSKAMPPGSYQMDRQKFYEIWSYRKGFIPGKFYIDQYEMEDIEPEFESDKPGMTLKQRQWNQINLVKEGKKEPLIYTDELKEELAQFKYPYNLIDFETMITALPFHKGMRPYEIVAFQFSHHLLQEDGTVTHVNEWINTQQGHFPNFEFLRKLKDSLLTNNGSIFRYAAHENTVLNKIKDQLMVTHEPDKNELIDFIDHITNESNGNGKMLRVGERSMIDICTLVRNYYLHPLMKGSNSIKKVLPAILNTSDLLKNKYGRPVYGTEAIISRNFKNMTWVKEANGMITDPYQLLDPFFDLSTDKNLDDRLEMGDGDDSIYVGDGGAAMVAYAEMQFSDMPEEAIKSRIQSLLKYCELDTLAMVMIMEEFRSIN